MRKRYPEAWARLRRSPNPTPVMFEALLPIFRGLMQMQKAGFLSAVHVNRLKISIRWPGQEILQAVSWKEAETLVSEFNRGAV